MRILVALLFLCSVARGQFLSPGLDWSAVPAANPFDPYLVGTIYRDWAHEDLTVGITVSNQWVDRIASDQMYQMNTTLSPTNSAIGVRFNGGQYLTNSPIALIGTGPARSMFVVYQVDTQSALNLVVGEHDGYGLFVNTSSDIQYFGQNGNFTIGAIPTGTNQDAFIVVSNATSCTLYTNGVLAVSGNSAGGVATSGLDTMGGGTGGFKIKGYVTRYILYTNLLGQAAATTLHSFRTNSYGGYP